MTNIMYEAVRMCTVHTYRKDNVFKEKQLMQSFTWEGGKFYIDKAHKALDIFRSAVFNFGVLRLFNFLTVCFK